MTTNIERAAEVIHEFTAGALGKNLARSIAQALADAGRLKPDLPKPMQTINPRWAKFNEHIEVSYGSVLVYFADNYGEESENLTPAEAREQAAYLDAAADYIEQEHDDV